MGSLGTQASRFLPFVWRTLGLSIGFHAPTPGVESCVAAASAGFRALGGFAPSPT